MRAEDDADLYIENLLSADLEYRLTVAAFFSNGDDQCACYLIERRTILIPQLIKKAERENLDVADVIHEFTGLMHMHICGKDTT